MTVAADSATRLAETNARLFYESITVEDHALEIDCPANVVFERSTLSTPEDGGRALSGSLCGHVKQTGNQD